MAGQFTKTNRTKRPGAYFNWTADQAEPILDNTIGILALPFTHDWGPENTVVELGSFGDFLSIFGPGASKYTPGYKAVLQAFQGEGLPGRGGAAIVLAYRMVGSAGAAASKAIDNTDAAPVTGITLTARYKGAKGNSLKVTVRPWARRPTTYDELVILDGNTEIESFPYAKTNIASLVSQVNAKSDWVTAVLGVSGFALASTTKVALSGGNDGASLVAGDWTAAMSAIEPRRFSLFAPHNLTAASILASLVAWSQALNGRGRRFMTVVGGALDENLGDDATSGTAVYRSAITINDPNFVNIGVGSVKDARLGVLSTAQLAPRIAGILARKGENESLSFARLAGLEIVNGATESQILDAIEQGVVVLGQDSHPDAPVRLERGVTAFVDDADPDRPYSVYSVPKFVRTMHAFEIELTEFFEFNVIGRMAVSDGTRSYIRGQAAARLAVRETAGVIQPGWSVDLDPDLPPQPTDDFVALRYQFTFGRSLEQVLNTVVVA